MASVTISDIRNARERIGPYCRHTPVLEATTIPGVGAGRVILKLENLQVTGSFKARGAISKLTTLAADDLARGIVTASGGNHGVAVAYAGSVARRPATIFVPRTVDALKAQKIESYGATLIRHGTVFDDANEAARERARTERLAYFHPFADPAVIAGQGTLGLEILEEVPEVDTILVAVGGGGLVAGIGTAVKSLRPRVRIVGIEPVGAPTLKASLDAGEIVMLDRITTRVPTMAARRTEPLTFSVAREVVDAMILVEDDAMAEAARSLWHHYGIAADLSGAAATAVLMQGLYRPAAGETVCALVCGAGRAGWE